VDDLERYAQQLAPVTRAKVLGDNVKRIYRLPTVPARASAPPPRGAA
jgi:hypothetical protein